jgi:hypothetical protein
LIRRSRLFRRAAWALAALVVPALARAAPIARAELAALCANADDQAHCGRLVEARQLRTAALSRIAERDGDELRVSLAPFGLSVFHDSVNVTGVKSYAVWDYLGAIDTLVLFTTDGERTGFMLVQRHGGDEYRVPSEPVMAPGERRFATADFCPETCDNQLAIWHIGEDGVRKEATWTPPDAWSDVTVAWKGADAISVEYSLANESHPRTMERRLGDPSWKKVRAK